VWDCARWAVECGGRSAVAVQGGAGVQEAEGVVFGVAVEGTDLRCCCTMASIAGGWVVWGCFTVASWCCKTVG
jgi:hypothetical protein